MFILFVRHNKGRENWLELVDHTSWTDVVRDAADYEMGEYDGQVMGAVEVDQADIVTGANLRLDLWSAVRDELSQRKAYRAGDKLAQWEAEKHDR